MRFALMIEAQQGLSYAEQLDLARLAERLGFEAFFRSDHYRSFPGPDGKATTDAWTVLAGIARETSTIRLGALVSPVTFRHVSVLAKSVVTVDHISAGRVELGVGAGWFEPDHLAYGFPFLTARERVDELERQLAEINRQWTEADDVWPKPVQRPRPPIIVGGMAKPRTVHAAVRFADEYNTIAPTLEEARDRYRVVADASRAAGREPLRFSIFLSCVVGQDDREVADRLQAWHDFSGLAGPPDLVGTVEQVVEVLRQYEAIGVYRAMLQQLVTDDVEMVSLLGEVAGALAG